MKELTVSQKKYLKGLSHALDASVIIGKSGLSTSLIEEVRRALAAHELIKIKFNKSKDKKDELAEVITRETESLLVSKIGNFIVLYKQAKKTEDRKIKLVA